MPDAARLQRHGHWQKETSSLKRGVETHQRRAASDERVGSLHRVVRVSVGGCLAHPSRGWPAQSDLQYMSQHTFETQMRGTRRTAAPRLVHSLQRPAFSLERLRCSSMGSDARSLTLISFGEWQTPCHPSCLAAACAPLALPLHALRVQRSASTDSARDVRLAWCRCGRDADPQLRRGRQPAAQGGVLGGCAFVSSGLLRCQQRHSMRAACGQHAASCMKPSELRCMARAAQPRGARPAPWPPLCLPCPARLRRAPMECPRTPTHAPRRLQKGVWHRHPHRCDLTPRRNRPAHRCQGGRPRAPAARADATNRPAAARRAWLCGASGRPRAPVCTAACTASAQNVSALIHLSDHVAHMCTNALPPASLSGHDAPRHPQAAGGRPRRAACVGANIRLQPRAGGNAATEHSRLARRPQPSAQRPTVSHPHQAATPLPDPGTLLRP